MAIQFLLKFCFRNHNQNVKVVRGLRLTISVLDETRSQIDYTVVNIIDGPKCFKIDTVTCILKTKLCFRYTFLSQKLNLVLELLIIWTLFYLGPNRVHYTATPGGPGSSSRNSLEHLYFQNGKICKFHLSFFLQNFSELLVCCVADLIK